jgi:sugar phosphate isomerase/epimerase
MSSLESRLAYCTNVLAAPTVDTLVDSLDGAWGEVRDRSGLPRLGLGLWFPRPVAERLATDPDAVERVREALAHNDLDVLTYNAFPAEAFHAPEVKQAVYRPDWLDGERRMYTLQVARIAGLLASPGDVVPVSTLPLGFPKWDAERRRRAADTLCTVAMNLVMLEKATGVSVRLALEPEPACALETTDEVLAFWQNDLIPVAGPRLEHVAKHLGVCLDLCHAAVEHEDPVAALARYEEAGVAVHKVQVSAALHVPDPTDPAQREHLSAFAEPRWLHQVGAADGRIAVDLPDALADDDLAAAGPWRVHFHVPLHRAEVGGLPTTRDDVARFLGHVAAREHPPLLELETYTWSVVPGEGDDLAENVAAEIRWARDTLGG